MQPKDHIDEHHRLSNKDLLPAKQKWNWYNIFAFWMSDVHSAGGYVFAGTLFSLGLTGWQVFISLILGIIVVQGLANLIGRPSQRYAVPFPVISRMTFGVFGSNIPAMIRGIIAIVWYGIQTYLASVALQVLALYIWPSLSVYTQTELWGLSHLGWGCFFVMWIAQTILFLCDMHVIRVFIDWAGPVVYAAMIVLMGYVIYEAGWENISFSLTDKDLTWSESLWAIILGATLIVSYFSGPTLNFGDFSRYCASEKDMRKGNFWGLPVNFLFFSAIAVVTISGTPAIFGEMIIDPMGLMGKIDYAWLTFLLGFTLLTATVGVNVVANFVSAAFDISNIAPSKINWRIGGLIASVLSVVILPWNLFNDPEVIHNTIDVLAAMIGPIYGVLIVDYYFIQKKKIFVADLYSDSDQARYWYTKGFHIKAILCLLVGSGCALVPEFISVLQGYSNFSFFIGSLTAAGCYYLSAYTHRVKPYQAPKQRSKG